ncbi:cytochrome oxidase c subunit VIb [Paraphaeosphaeria sporulosa]
MSDEETETKPFNRYATHRESSREAPGRLRRAAQARAISWRACVDGNQTKHCWQNYVDYHKCITAKGEDFAPCRQFLLAYRSLCPSGWTSRWDDQREKGIFPCRLDQ